MFSLYTVLLTLHILSVAAWVGGSITVQLITRAAGDDPAWPPIFITFGARFFPPVTGLTGLLGLALWIDGGWDFTDLWILIAVAGWIGGAVVGATQLTPRLKRWAEGDAAARADFMKIAQIDLALLVLIMADMVMKPGL